MSGRRRTRSPWSPRRVVAAAVALCLLGVLAQVTSPAGSLAEPLTRPLADLGRTITDALTPGSGGGAPLPDARSVGASRAALADIPSDYLAYYITSARTCPALTWQLLAGIGKVETNHGRSSAPGVRSGLNRFGCCAGPMQFNLTNGPPSTWDGYRQPGDSVYDPADAIPAAARKLCNDGLATTARGRDPCPQLPGTPAQHRALKRYNNACWYARQVLAIATTYTTTTPADRASPDRASPDPARPAQPDPIIGALVRTGRIQVTTSHGCNPGPDLARGALDLRVMSILAALADRWTIRISCARTGHSTYVKGTRRVSNHHVGRGVDIDQVNGHNVNRASRDARQLAGWLNQLSGPLRPSEIGSPWQFSGRPYFTNEGHQEHIHIGYSATYGE